MAYRLVDANSGAPIVAARIIPRSGRELRSDDAGQFSVGLDSSSFAILHPDYRAECHDLSPNLEAGAQQPMDLALKPLGRLVVRVDSSLKSPRAGDKIHIMPDPGTHKGALRNWRQIQDSLASRIKTGISMALNNVIMKRDFSGLRDGILSRYGCEFSPALPLHGERVVFKGLNPEVSYRLFLEQGSAAEFVPPFESNGITPVENSPELITVDANVVPGHMPSGIISLDKSLCQSALVKLLPESLVAGVLPVDDVPVFSFRLLHHTGVGWGIRRRTGLQPRFLENGEFEIRGLVPGESYVLQIIQSRLVGNEDEYWLAARRIQAVEGRLDLGRVLCRPVDPIWVKASGFDADSGLGELALQLLVFDKSWSKEGRVEALFPLFGGHSTKVHGVRTGSSLTLGTSLKTSVALSSRGIVLGVPRARAEVVEGVTVYELDLKPRKSCVLTVESSLGESMWIGLRGEDGSTHGKELTSRKLAQGYSLHLHEQRWTIVVQVESEDNSGSFVMEKLDLRSPSRIKIDNVKAGAGVIVESTPARILAIAMKGFPFHIYEIPESGSLRIAGLVPEAVYHSSDGKLTFTTGGPGTVVTARCP